MKRWFLLIFVCLLFGANSAYAQTSYTVTDTTDLPDDNVGDGMCQTAVDTCTLRAAIQEANVTSGNTTIHLPAGTYPLTRQGILEDEAIFGDLDLQSDMIIQGDNPDTTIIQASHGDRVFHLLSGEINLQDLTLQGGNAGDLLGGGIWNQSTLALQNVVVKQNQAYRGGGIFNEGILTLRNVTIAENTGEDGLGIYNQGQLTMIDGALQNNQIAEITNHPHRYFGGGLQNDGTAILTQVTVQGNRAVYGGGIRNRGTLVLQDSNIVENQNNYGGGGIQNLGEALVVNSVIEGNFKPEHLKVHGTNHGVGVYNAGHMTIRHSQIRQNRAHGFGGGIFNDGQLALQNNLIEENSSRLGGGIYNAGAMTMVQNEVKNNLAEQHGGGIYNKGWLSVSSSLIQGNQANEHGGGLYLTIHSSYYDYEASFITLHNTAIDNNQADAQGNSGGLGGGVYSEERARFHMFQSSVTQNMGDGLHGYGSFLIESSTISDNEEDGIHFLGETTVELEINNSSIINNGRDGLYNALGLVRLNHSVLTRNAHLDCNSSSILQSGGYNLISDSLDSCPIDGDVESHLPVGTTVLLSATLTIDETGAYVYPITSADSALVDAGAEDCQMAYDQRQFVRAFDGDGDGTAVCDIGAYEYGVFADLNQTIYLPVIQKGNVTDAIPATGNARLSHIPEPETVGLTMGALGISLVFGLVLLQGRNLKRE